MPQLMQDSSNTFVTREKKAYGIETKWGGDSPLLRLI